MKVERLLIRVSRRGLCRPLLCVATQFSQFIEQGLVELARSASDYQSPELQLDVASTLQAMVVVKSNQSDDGDSAFGAAFELRKAHKTVEVVGGEH